MAFFGFPKLSFNLVAFFQTLLIVWGTNRLSLPSIAPVNSLRVILNTLFGVNLPLLALLTPFPLALRTSPHLAPRTSFVPRTSFPLAHLGATHLGF